MEVFKPLAFNETGGKKTNVFIHNEVINLSVYDRLEEVYCLKA
jgi:hypothetical protein